MSYWRIDPRSESNPENITDDSIHGYLLLFVVTMPLGMLRSVLNFLDAGGHLVLWWLPWLVFMPAFWLIYTVAAICLRSRDAVFAAKTYLYYSIMANAFSLIAALKGLIPLSPVDPFTLAAILISTVWLIYFSRSEVVEARFPEASRRVFVFDWIGMAVTLIIPAITICLLPMILTLTMRPADDLNNGITAEEQQQIDNFNIVNSIAYTDRLDRSMPLQTDCGLIWAADFNPETITTELRMKDLSSGDPMEIARSVFDRFPSILYHLTEFGNDLLLISLDHSDHVLGQWRLSPAQLRDVATHIGISSARIHEGLNRYLSSYNNSRIVTPRYHRETDFGIAPRNRGIEHTFIVPDYPEKPFNPDCEAMEHYAQRLHSDPAAVIDYYDALEQFHLPLTIRFIGSSSGRTATITLPAPK